MVRRKKKLVSKEFFLWLNEWANFHKHHLCSENNIITEYGKGYQQAIQDVFSNIKVERE